jgi:LysR family transcriptional regulator of abg operon
LVFVVRYKENAYMNPNLLKQLAVVVKHGSLTRACEHLYITQPTLTRSIKQLEMRAGAPLLKRTRYGVIPTEIGARLAQIGERILIDTEHADEVVRQFHSGYLNEFVVGIDPLWEYATVEQMTEYFLREKRYVFHFRTGSAAAQIELLKEGELDFLLAPAHLTVGHGSLDRELVFRDRSAVFAGKKSNLIGSEQPVLQEVLERQNWMIAGANAGFITQQGDLAGMKAARVAYTGSIRSVLHLLNTTDMLVRLPARLTLMTGEVDLEQMLEVDERVGIRRDIALWSHAEKGDRPEILKVRELVSGFAETLDHKTSLYGLDL